MSYRVSVTTIEKFRRYMTEASTFDTEESLLDSIKGFFLGNDKTKFGEAWGKIIEEGHKFKHVSGNLNGYLVDGIFFSEELARPAVEFAAAHPKMIYEVPVAKEYEVNGMTILVSGRTDGIEGNITRDTKCKFRTPDFQEYVDSYQWRFYLDMLNAKTFYYDVFEVQGFDSLVYDKKGIAWLHDINIIPYEPLYCSSYSEMHDDCKLLLRQFFEYIEEKNLYQFLKPYKSNA